MFYHLVKKHRNSPAYKKAYYWYYWYIDSISGRQVQKACINCKTRDEAEKFIDELPDPTRLKKTKYRVTVISPYVMKKLAYLDLIQFVLTKGLVQLKHYLIIVMMMHIHYLKFKLSGILMETLN